MQVSAALRLDQTRATKKNYRVKRRLDVCPTWTRSSCSCARALVLVRSPVRLSAIVEQRKTEGDCEVCAQFYARGGALRTATSGEPSVHRRRVAELCVAPCSGVLEEWRKHHSIKKKDKMRMPPIQVRDSRLFPRRPVRRGRQTPKWRMNLCSQLYFHRPPAESNGLLCGIHEKRHDIWKGSSCPQRRGIHVYQWVTCGLSSVMSPWNAPVAASYFCARVLGTCLC